MGEDPAIASAVPNVVPSEPPRAPAPPKPAKPSKQAQPKPSNKQAAKPARQPPKHAAGSAAPSQPPRIAPARVRARLARLGGARHPNRAPMLEPLFRVVRATHPKADLGIIERAYRTAEKYHTGQMRKSGDAVHHAPARGRHDPRRARYDRPDPVRRAAARHGRGHAVHARRPDQGVRRRDRHAGRRRDQAGQGQVRRVRAGRDDPQDGRRDGQGHPGAGDQARGPAAQHAHAAVRPAGEAGAHRPRDAGDLRPAGAPARYEHDQVGARGPVVLDPAPEGVRRDRAAGRRARTVPRRVPRQRDRPGARRPARRRR